MFMDMKLEEKPETPEHVEDEKSDSFSVGGSAGVSRQDEDDNATLLVDV